MTTIRDILAAIDAEYSLSRAEKWDKVGLLIGDANASANRVLVAHEVTAEIIDEATNCNADALVVYHPPLFRPLENLDFSNPSVRIAARCIRANIAVIAVHTALDNAPFGRALGDKLAAELGLTNVRVLDASGRESLSKIVVFVPLDSLTQVQEAMWNAGAARIGNYDRASFRVQGKGTFRPLENAVPHFGNVGEDEIVDEWRLEVLVAQSKRDAVIRAMKAAHPYEEVAHDIYKLENNGGENWGAARIGELVSSTRLHDFADAVKANLRAPNLRVVASKNDEIRIVACVPGSGASYLAAVAEAGANCLVTGDIKHHDALQAQAQNIALIDATHTATERAAIEMIAAALQKSSTRLNVEIVRSAIDTNPFQA